MPHQNLKPINPDFAKYPFVSIDVETSGLDPNSNEILEIAIREFNMNREFGSVLHQFCCPRVGFINDEVTKINGITYDMVYEMPWYDPEVHELAAQFIGQRTVIGHNFSKFDKAFIKITPVAEEDTLTLCRSRFPRGKNNLKASCERFGIKWDEEQAHGALYDADKAVELFWALKGIKETDAVVSGQRDLFAAPVVAQEESKRANYLSVGITPDPKHVEMLATQAYSYSRIRLFRECAYRWYFEYILKIKQPTQDYLQVGQAAHEIIERSGEWCQHELFINKFEAWSEKTNPVTPVEILESLKGSDIQPTPRSIGHLLYVNRELIRQHYDPQGIAHFHYKMDMAIPHDSYEHPAMPDIETYSKYIMRAVTNCRIEEADTITDLEAMMWKFYRHKDFSKTLSIVSITEKKLAFDSTWNLMPDFYALNVFFRGIIDLIEYSDDTVIITDYKSSRTMMPARELKNDIQLKVYILLLLKFLPRDSFKRVTVRIEYMRFCKTIEYTFENIQQAADEALHWINTAVHDLEVEMLKKDGDAFLPTRNEHCHTCHIGIEGNCPLFNKNLIQKLDTDGFVVSNEEECRLAWKRVEANKAEIQKLTSQCKQFMKTCDHQIQIDGQAYLDFWATETRDFDPFKTFMMLLKKGFKIKDFIRYTSFPPSSLEKFLAAHQVELTDDERSQISTTSVKHTFDAYTPQQSRNKSCLNAHVIKTEESAPSENDKAPE